jgi:hypothetical protein
MPSACWVTRCPASAAFTIGILLAMRSVTHCSGWRPWSGRSLNRRAATWRPCAQPMREVHLPRPRHKNPLPSILGRRGKDTVENAAAAWDALLSRYDLTDLHGQLRSTPNEWPHGGRLAAFFWSSLASQLMSEFVPAFKGPPNAGRPSRFYQEDHISDILAAGGRATLLTVSEETRTRFYQAQYADAVRKIAADRGRGASLGCLIGFPKALNKQLPIENFCRDHIGASSSRAHLRMPSTTSRTRYAAIQRLSYLFGSRCR